MENENETNDITQMNDEQLLLHLVDRYGEYLLQDDLRLRNFMFEALVDRYDTLSREDLITELNLLTE